MLAQWQLNEVAVLSGREIVALFTILAQDLLDLPNMITALLKANVPSCSFLSSLYN